MKALLLFLLSPLAYAGLPPVTSTNSSITVLPGQKVQCNTASASQNGCLSSTDWGTFSGLTSQPIPSAVSTTLVTTTSASTTFVTALTTSITVTAASAPVLAKCVLDMSSATAASVGSVVVTINAVSGGAVRESFTVIGTQRLTVPNQYLSAALPAGTYTVNCDFNRISGTGTVTVNQGSLTAVALQGSRAVSGVVTLAGGGTNASNTAVNGGVAYGTASAINLSAAGTLGQLLRSGGAAAPTWTAQTFPASSTINQIMYSSANNVVDGIATANTGALVTSSTGVPSITSGATANRLLRTNGTAVTFAQANLTTDVTGILPVINGGTGLSTINAAGRVLYSNGSTQAGDSLFTYDAANNRLTIGNGGTSRLSAVVLTTDVQPNDYALNVYSRATTRGAMVLQNENTQPTLNMTNSGGTAIGANIVAEASRGTLPTRTQSQSTDMLFSLTAHGRTTTGWSTGYGATMGIVATENVTDTTNGAEMFFSTTPNGAAAVVERARITNDGQLKAHYGVSVNTSTAQPTCDSSRRGLWWVIQGGVGVADVLQICLKDAADIYGWVTK